MRDLIVQQNAQPLEGDILDAEDNKNDSKVNETLDILKSILKSIEYSLTLQEALEYGLEKAKDKIVDSISNLTQKVETISEKLEATAERVQPDQEKENVSSSMADNIAALVQLQTKEVELADTVVQLTPTKEDRRESSALLEKQLTILNSIYKVLLTGTDKKKVEREEKGGFSVLDLFKGRGAKGSSRIKDIFKGIKNAPAKIMTGMKDIFKGGPKQILGNLLKGVKGFFSTILKGLAPLGKKLIGGVLKFILKLNPIVALLAGVFSGLIDGIQEYMKTGDVMKAITAGLGGFLEFLTFGLFDKEDVEKWMKGAKEIWNNLGKYVDEYLVQPFNKIVTTVGKALDEYIVQPVSKFVGTVSELFKQYVMDPIDGFLQSVTSVFTSITDSLMAFLTNFEIPKVSVTLPVVGEISAGPWKPFAGIASAIGGGGGGTAAPSAPPATSGNAVVASSAANDGARDNLATSSAPVIISAPSTNVQNSQNISIPQPVRNPDRSFTDYAGRNRVIA